MVFPWYGAAVPLTAGLVTPTWSTSAHLTFAATYGASRVYCFRVAADLNERNCSRFDQLIGINHTVLANSVPSANVYSNNQEATKTTARLINLSLAVVRTVSE